VQLLFLEAVANSFIEMAGNRAVSKKINFYPAAFKSRGIFRGGWKP